LGEFTRGWRTVAASAAGACVGLTGLGFYSFGLFVKPLAASFGWSRGQVGLGLSFITLGTVLAAPAVGLLTDRWGVRRVAVPALAGLALGYGLLAGVGPAIVSFYAACFGLALLGAGTTPVTWTRAVSVLFVQRRGLALGLTMLGSAVAGLLCAGVLQPLIQIQGFRTAYLAMAALTALVALPIVLVFLRDPAPAAAPDRAVAGEGLTQAARRPAFWMIGLAMTALITAQSGVTVHLVPLLTDRGMTPIRAAGVAGLMGLSVFFGRIGVGALLDRLHPPTVAVMSLMLPMTAAVMLATCGAVPSLLTAAALLLGLGAGAEIDLMSYFTARHFGTAAYGRIYGALFVLFSLGNGLGTPVFGTIYDHDGGYEPALWGAAALFAVGAGLFAALSFCRVHQGALAGDHGVDPLTPAQAQSGALV
jgi:predicted MFS family arabinose efflux permease